MYKLRGGSRGAAPFYTRALESAYSKGDN